MDTDEGHRYFAIIRCNEEPSNFPQWIYEHEVDADDTLRVLRQNRPEDCYRKARITLWRSVRFTIEPVADTPTQPSLPVEPTAGTGMDADEIEQPAEG